MLYPLYSVLLYCAAALASPSISGAPEKRLIVDPPVTSPTASTVWVVGNKYNVTWDTSQLPPLANISNVGRIVLGQFNGDGEKLYTDSPLATGFLLTDTYHEVTCPDVDDGDYIVILFGTATNASPQFKITRDPISSILDPASSSSASSSTPPAANTTSALASTSGSASGSPTSSASSTSSASGSTSGAAGISTPPLFSSIPSSSSLATSSQGTGSPSSPTPTQAASGAAVSVMSTQALWLAGAVSALMGASLL